MWNYKRTELQGNVCLTKKMSTGNMVSLCALVVFFAFYIVSISSRETPSLPDFATLCPHNDFCTSKAKSWLAPTSGKESSCQRCSCAVDCHLVGNCCPDKPGMTVTEPIYACKSTDFLSNNQREIYTYNNDVLYHIIDRCPDNDTSNKFPFCENPAKLEDFVIVSNVENEKVYKNRHCATCHGVHDFIEWELVQTCGDIMKKAFQSVEDRDSYVLKTCSLEARPPNRQIVEMAGCYHDYMVIRGCPKSTGQPAAYDTIELKKACYESRPNQNTMFKDGSSTTPVLYANIYCYLCNNPNQTDAPTSMETPENEPDRTVLFSSVLKKYNEDEKMGDEVCNQTQMWDNFTNVCRTLYCPAGMTAVHGQCEDSVAYSEGYTLFTLFKIEVLFGEMELTHRLLYKVHSYFEGIVEPIYECGICSGDLIQSNNTFYFRLTFLTRKRCSISTLLQLVRSIVAKTENITLVCGEELAFRILFVTEKVSFSIDREINGFSTFVCPTVPSQIDLTMLDDCPRFLIPARDLMNISSNNNVHHDPAGLDPVCVEKYFQMFQEQHQSGAESLYPHGVFYGIVILLYVSQCL